MSTNVWVNKTTADYYREHPAILEEYSIQMTADLQDLVTDLEMAETALARVSKWQISTYEDILMAEQLQREASAEKSVASTKLIDYLQALWEQPAIKTTITMNNYLIQVTCEPAE